MISHRNEHTKITPKNAQLLSASCVVQDPFNDPDFSVSNLGGNARDRDIARLDLHYLQHFS